MRHLEENLQAACVKWFRLQYPQYDGLLFHVPNGGRRNLKEAARLKAEGVVAGVADLILLVPFLQECVQYFNGLCIEMKTSKGKQSQEQKDWECKVREQGYEYKVIRSLDEFIEVVDSYLKGEGFIESNIDDFDDYGDLPF